VTGICVDRVAIVTGGGRGIGREHAIELARQGAAVVVNDVGAELDGTGSSGGPAGEVVDAIRGSGGSALANREDVSDWEGAGRLVQAAIDEFGRVDVVVCNAGIVRDCMLVNMSVDEWGTVIGVHLRGLFCPVRHAAGHWRERSKRGDDPDGRIITTTSTAGLFGGVSQLNYGTAKAGIAAFTRIAAAELGRYGVTVNSISPAARSRMTVDAFSDMMRKPEKGFDAMDAANISPIVAWLASREARDVTGQVFEVVGGELVLMGGWRRGPRVDKGDRWVPAELGGVVRELLAKADAGDPVIGTES
jgi:NAD(P)-dependent dehydrogenase (short-subunit alcohol dehydrogenase family)